MIAAGMARMLDDIARETRATALYTGLRRLSEPVMAAMAAVPREAFVPAALASQAYADGPLPIGRGQTISQPFIVALMTELLAPRAGQRVLELGTGSGYQAAVLSRLVERVYTLEIVAELAVEARERLQRLGYGNVEVARGDGHRGWPEHAPYDGIIITAAAERVPPPLFGQLRPGGRLVAPVGPARFAQQLRVYEKDEGGRYRFEECLPVAFVPFTGGDGEP